MMNSKTSEGKANGSQRLVFKIITLSFPIIILLLLEGILRLVSYGDSMKLFIQNPSENYEKYLIVNPDIGKKYFQRFEYNIAPNDIFLKKKTEGTFRIFVMGSSTVVGFPYEYNLMFSRILHHRLEEAYPEKNIEVVNTAITAINSYTLLDYTREILKYEPDAVLLYAGHNEFYGAFGVGSNESMSKSRTLTRLHFMLMDLRLYQFIRNIGHSAFNKIGSGKSEQVPGTLMKRIVANKNILADSDEYKLAMKRYEQNMGDLTRKFSSRGVPLFLSEVVSNVRDIKPLSYLSSGEPDEAWDQYKEAVRAYKSGDYENAKVRFYKAKDLDGVRFRASEDVNKIIRDLAEQYEIFKVPMLDYFQDQSPHGIIGDNLITEHVHPNIQGNFLMADAFFTEIMAAGIIGDSDVNSLHAAEYLRRNWGYTALDSLVAVHRVANLKNYWPFVSAEENRRDYRVAYKPISQDDSLAFIAFRDKAQSLYDLRLEQAEAYDEKGNTYEAYREFEALIRTNPYLAINYRDAASVLLKLSDLPLALKYFKKSLSYEQSYFSHYRMGEIYLIKGDYPNAIESFREAFPLSSDDDEKIKTLGKIYVACMFGNKISDAESIASLLTKNNASQYLKLPRKTYVYNQYIPYKTKDQILKAKQKISDGDLAEALSILEGSLAIYDSHIAHRLIGTIYFENGENQNAWNHFNRVYEEFRFDPDFLSNFIMLNISLKNTKQSKALLDELKQIDPENETIAVLSRLLAESD